MVGKKELIIYEPRKILDFIEKKKRVAPFDLQEFGYDFSSALYLLIQLDMEDYVKDSGRKYVRPPAVFVTDNDNIKKVAGGITQNAFELTEKGKYKKPEHGVMATISLVDFSEDITKDYAETSAEDREAMEEFLKGLFEANSKQLPGLLKKDIKESKELQKKYDDKIRRELESAKKV